MTTSPDRHDAPGGAPGGAPDVSAPPSFHLLAKPTGAACNLDCAYCFFLEKERLYPDQRTRMADATLERYIRQLIEAHQTPEVTIAWQGGEPMLMGLEFFRRAVELAKRYARPGMTVQHTIQTNGTKVDGAWSRFFAENGFLVGISIDGPRELHDAYRRDKGGKPTFDKVVRGLNALREYGVQWNALTTVNAANEAHPREVYRFLRDECACEFVQFIPIVELPCKDGVPYGDEVTDRSVTPAGWGDFLIGVFEEWVRRDVGEVYVQHFDVALANWYGEPSGLCVHSPTCGTALAMEWNGDVYACDHFVDPAYLRGNIGDRHLAELVGSPEQERFGLDKLERLPRYCRECDVRFACHGGCPKDRFVATPDGEPGLNYLCPGYKAFFHHVDAPMKRMCELLREDRAPAEIVAEYAGE
ncbi:MAG TPA: anaerobic sulfatase maturase [Thermoleophilia bacterium]|nr:anaerobic sulfatase maturase [Thermoleophilia bacterium]